MQILLFSDDENLTILDEQKEVLDRQKFQKHDLKSQKITECSIIKETKDGQIQDTQEKYIKDASEINYPTDLKVNSEFKDDDEEKDLDGNMLKESILGKESIFSLLYLAKR